MLLGFALTRHCNLRCPHCIRDDVATVRSLEPDLVLTTVDEALALFGDVTASFTGGEPTLHPDWNTIVAALHERGVPYRFVSNGWHMGRMMPSIDRWPPQYVRLSLSGATEAIHDAERGRGSFRRVLLALALLTSRGIPTALSIVIDKRDRLEIGACADLAEQLGATRLHYILPQPVPFSVERGSDLPPSEWAAVRGEVDALAAVPGRRTVIQLDYGAPPPPGEAEIECDTKAFKRVYVDAAGRLSLCCQMSEYGGNDDDVIADLHRVSLTEAWWTYTKAIVQLRRRTSADTRRTQAATLPCMRCAKSLGKLRWLEAAEGPWQAAAV